MACPLCDIHGGTDTVEIYLSGLAILISGVTAWLTLLKPGSVKMTRPTVIFFGPDGSRGPAKVFLRTLLYCTSRRGRIIQGMFVRLRRGESAQNFNVWVYGDDSLKRGSGLYVGQDGVVCNHHFLLPRDGTQYEFLGGRYVIEVFAELVNARRPVKLAEEAIDLSQDFASRINKQDSGVYYDWGPDSQTYHANLDCNPVAEINYKIKKQMKVTQKDVR